MIINTISQGNRFAYRCNGVNDDIDLVTFVTQLRATGLSNFTVEINGQFGKSNAAAITIDNTGYTQTGAMQIPGGHGAYAGTFYMAPVVGTNIKSLASYNRNRS